MARLVGMTTQLPLLPTEQVDESLENYRFMGVVRPISIGDRFRLFTRNPARVPLPHLLLLSLHCMLWDMIAGAALNETAKAKQACVPPSTAQHRLPGAPQANRLSQPQLPQPRIGIGFFQFDRRNNGIDAPDRWRV